MLEIDDHLQTLSIEESWVTIKLIKTLEDIPLDDSDLDQITCIGTQMNSSVSGAYTFPKEQSKRVCLEP